MKIYSNTKKKWFKVGMIVLVGLTLNCFFFFIFPVLSYLKNASLEGTDTEIVNIALTKVNLNEKKKKVKKIKVKEERPKRRSQQKTSSRFKLKFGVGSGTGADAEVKKISGMLYKEGEVDKLPQRKEYNIPSLDFPASLKGSVVKILIHIDELGQVVYAEVVQGVDGYNINAILKNALMRWEFTPALVNNIPVKMEMIQPIRL